MKDRPVLPLVLSMSLPMVLSMLVNSLYNIVDSFFVAQISEDAMTALSLVYPVQNLITAVGVGFGIGINAVIAFHLGAGEKDKADRAASQGMLLSVVHGVGLTLLCILGLPAFLGAFTQSPSVLALGVAYGQVAFAFTLIIVLGLTFEKTFQAVGRMKATMASLLAGCVTNIVFPQLGITGAALATGLGQSLTLGIYLVLYHFRPIPVTIARRDMAPTRTMVRRLYAIGVPATLNLALPSVLVSALNGILATFSQGYVLVLGIYYKLQTFLYLPANGFVQGMRPLVGYNYGAGEIRRVRQISRVVLGMSGLILAAGTVVCQAIPAQLMGLFTANPETVAMGAVALRVISLGFVVSAVSVTLSGALEGLGKGLPSLAISLCRYLVVILPVAWGLSRTIGPTGVWHAFWITEVVAAVVAWAVYRRALRSPAPQRETSVSPPPAP